MAFLRKEGRKGEEERDFATSASNGGGRARTAGRTRTADLGSANVKIRARGAPRESWAGPTTEEGEGGRKAKVRNAIMEGSEQNI